ncbi:MAG: CsbD family protein [Thermoflexales bacterium]
MNKDEFEGKWKQIRGQARQWWGKLTDDDVERVGGKYEQFVGLVQEKYGYTREAAETEINKRVAEFDANQKKQAAPVK